jgi:hypothetical protein
VIESGNKKRLSRGSAKGDQETIVGSRIIPAIYRLELAPGAHALVAAASKGQIPPPL